MMKLGVVWVLAGLFASTILVSLAAGWEIPLAAEEQHGVAGPRRITCGVPLLPGQAKDIKDLRVLAKDASGKTTPVPAQFRELARWWRADNSLRWVLVDLATDIGAKETRTFILTDAKLDAPAPAAKLTFEQNDESITVTTGLAKFVINRKKFNFLDKAILDLAGDGKLTDDRNLLASTPECGTVTQDTFGQKYLSSAGTASVEVVESGPMRVCVRARGQHRPADGKGYSAGLYGYDVFMNFYAGSTDVYCDVIVTNNPPKSTGIPAMEDGSLILKLAGGATGYRLIGEKPAEAKDGSLASGESVCLYQDSNGADTWATCPGFGKMGTNGWSKLSDQLTSFRGYKVFKRAGGKEEQLSAGDHARGTLAAWNDRGGVVLHVKHFWQQFPKAAEVSADGTLRLGMWPGEWKWPHMLQDASAKGFEVILHFYGAKAPADPYARDGAGRPSAETVADCWDSRVMLRPPLSHMGATGALADAGPYTPPTKGIDKKPDTRTAAENQRMFTDDALYGNAFGWRVYGERWRSNGGHGSLGARQPIDEDNYLFRWYVTGLPEWFTAGDNRSRQFRDVRRYRIDGVDALAFKGWADFHVANVSERDEWTKRPQPDTEEAKKYQQGLPGYGSGWSFPNPEHYTLDLLNDRYLLFGDIRAFENMRVAAGFGAFFARDYAPKPGADVKAINPCISRDRGWAWRTLERYWELTGDKRADELLREIIKAYEPLIDKTGLWFPTKEYQREWFTKVFSRAAAMTALHTGDPKALEICRALASDKEKDHPGDFATLLGALYQLTGEEHYKAPLAKAIESGSLQIPGGYFSACDAWLLSQPPKAARPSAPMTSTP